MVAQSPQKAVWGIGAALWVCWLLAAGAFGAEGRLEFRTIQNGRPAETGSAISAEAIRVFVYEGAPREVVVADHLIAVDYGLSGVLFDRASGKVLRRFTVADGWPAVRPEPFQPRESLAAGHRQGALVGPGVAYGYGRAEEPQPVVAASVAFQGRQWRALQPHRFLETLGRGTDWREQRQQWGSWTPILRRLNELSYVEMAGEEGAPARRFTMEDGLASNVVTHLVVAQGSLWAACVDIYEPEREEWGPGGLCRFDPEASRWERVEWIDGRQVRWVTLLQVVDGELWAGFREGSGIAGDTVAYGMGLYPGRYRPQTTAIVLARLAAGKWTTFSRAPRPDRSRSPARLGTGDKEELPTEKPYCLAKLSKKVLLLTQSASVRLSGNWQLQQDMDVSVLDEVTGEWRDFDLYEDFDADQLLGILAASDEVIVSSNRGAHRWDADTATWQFLDSGCSLCNPNLSAAVPVGEDLWVGYTNLSFGIVGKQGISRFDERSGRWSHMLPEQIGTGCPVRRIVALPGGEVWVLFQPRAWMGSAAEFPYYPREAKVPRPGGLGRFSSGVWEFPVTLPKAAQDEGPDSPYGLFLYGTGPEMVGVGDKLFFADPTGIYVGPREWRRILSGPWLAIEPSEDGQGLSIIRAVPGGDSSGQNEVQRGRYETDGGEVAFETVKAESTGWERWDRPRSLLDRPAGASWAGEWVRVPAAKEGIWAVGLLSSAHHVVVETSAAVWIASPGELIRLDRRLLKDWLGK